MKVVIVPSYFGFFAFNEENALVAKVLFPKKPQVAAKTLMKFESGQVTKELKKLMASLQSCGYEAFVFGNSALAKEVQQKLNVKTETSKQCEAAEILRSNPEKIAVETGFIKDSEEFDHWTYEVSMEITKSRVKGAVEKRDLIVTQTIHTVDDLDRTLNLFMGRLREWYGIHFPELDRLVEKHETYARLVAIMGGRQSFSFDALKKADIPKARAKVIAKVSETSMGGNLLEADLLQIQMLGKSILELFSLRKSMGSYLDKTMVEVAPNTRTIAGSLLGARLIAAAGSLETLARRPASTIQVLGAEKALFRSLKTGARPPKHGMIFQHSLVHDAKSWQRGKIARALAGKLAIAARADAFGGRLIGELLKTALDKRIDEILKKYKDPPQPRERKPKIERKRYNKRWRKKRRERKG